MHATLLGLVASLWLGEITQEPCLARIPCPVGETCGCRIVPVNEYARFFYFDVRGVELGKRYSCHLLGSSQRLQFTPDLSVFPPRAIHRCPGGCGRLPLFMEIDLRPCTHGDPVVLLKVHMPIGGAAEDVQIDCRQL